MKKYNSYMKLLEERAYQNNGNNMRNLLAQDINPISSISREYVNEGQASEDIEVNEIIRKSLIKAPNTSRTTPGLDIDNPMFQSMEIKTKK